MEAELPVKKKGIRFHLFSDQVNILKYLFSESAFTMTFCFWEKTINSCGYIVVTVINLNYTWVSTKTLITWSPHLTLFSSILQLQLWLQINKSLRCCTDSLYYSHFAVIFIFFSSTDFPFFFLPIQQVYQSFTDQNKFYLVCHSSSSMNSLTILANSKCSVSLSLLNIL